MSEPNLAAAPLLVKVPEACAAIGCGVTKLYELIRSGRLRVVKIGRGTRIVFADLQALASPPPRAPTARRA